jgi:hypothetical protein
VTFSETTAPPAEEHVDPALGPHQVLGPPRLDF